MLIKNITNEFIKFAFIGCFIFIIDMIFFYFLNLFFEFLLSRFISYSFATYVAYELNKKITFEKNKSSFILYYIGTSIAGIQNIFISFFLVKGTFIPQINEFYAIGIGCIYGLFFNFLFQKKITFKHD
jgi:putative flippase GtrA